MKKEIDKIKKLIAVDNVEEALNMLLAFDFIDKQSTNEIILNSSKFHEVNSLERIGIIKRENSALEKSNIRYALLQIIDRLYKENSLSDLKEMPDKLYSKQPLELFSTLNGEKLSINNIFDEVYEKIKSVRKRKKIEKFKFLFNSLSDRRLDAISKQNLILAKDISSEIFALLSIFEEDFQKDLKNFNAFNSVVSGRLLSAGAIGAVAGATVGTTIAGAIGEIFVGAGFVGINSGIALRAIAILNWTTSEYKFETLSKELRMKRLREIIEK